jgi:predicted nucleic acid-binding protein
MLSHKWKSVVIWEAGTYHEKNAMNAKFLVDTNLLLYGYDKDAEEKHDIAVTWLKRLWETQTGIISTQVLQEF